MSGRYTTGERRGMIAVLAVLLVFIGLALWRTSGHAFVDAPTADPLPYVEATPQPADTSATPKVPAHTKRRKKTTKTQKASPAPSPPARNPLDEIVN